MNFLISERHANPPLVSVVVACYNAGATVGQTLRSLQAQSHARWEAICVDDGSTDETGTILADLAARDERIRIGPGPHQGVALTKRTGVAHARGDYVMVLDSDDAIVPDGLETMLRVSRLVGSETIINPGFELHDAEGRPLGRYEFPHLPEFNVDALLLGNGVCCMALVPRGLLAHGSFDADPPACVDWNLWLRLAHQGARCVSLRRALHRYRLHGGSVSHGADRMFAAGRRVLERWSPFATAPAVVAEAPKRLALRYGVMAAISGDAEAPARYWRAIGEPAMLTDVAQQAAGAVYGLYEFVHGASGATWRSHADAWMRDARSWLCAGLFAPWTDEILAAVEPLVAAQIGDASAALTRLLADRPDVRRVVVYGLGQNGGRLLQQWRQAGRQAAAEWVVADDFDQGVGVATHGLPRVDPRTWSHWPEATLAVVTPNECHDVIERLAQLGGRPGCDFVTYQQLAAEDADALAATEGGLA